MATNIRQYLSESTPTSFKFRDGPGFIVEGSRMRGGYAIWVSTSAATYQMDAGIQGRDVAMGIAWAIFNLRHTLYRAKMSDISDFLAHEYHSAHHNTGE